jgi:hypothetical protein
MNKITAFFLLLTGVLLLSGFSLDNAIIPKDEILSGGPPKDGIPAILKPKFVTAETATYLVGHDQVIAVKIGGESRAYPIKILNHHEVVNDTVGGVPIAVTF